LIIYKLHAVNDVGKKKIHIYIWFV